MPKTHTSSPIPAKKKEINGMLPSPNRNDSQYKSLDDEDIVVENLKPLIPFSLESGLSGNSKTVDDVPNQQNNDYNSNSKLRSK